jgi:hypothetical protein
LPGGDGNVYPEGNNNMSNRTRIQREARRLSQENGTSYAKELQKLREQQKAPKTRRLSASEIDALLIPRRFRIHKDDMETYCKVTVALNEKFGYYGWNWAPWTFGWDEDGPFLSDAVPLTWQQIIIEDGRSIMAVDEALALDVDNAM